MSRLEFTPKARQDVEDIWSYSVEQFGIEKAESYLRDIQRACETVAKNPRRGVGCDHIRAGYRKVSVGSHVVFYRVVERSVIVVRVLRQRMDFESRLP